MTMLDGINGVDKVYQANTVTAHTEAGKLTMAENEMNTDNFNTAQSVEDVNKSQNDGSDNQVTVQNEKIKKAVEDINKKSSNSEAIFGIHDATNRVTIKIIDKTTRDVIKEFPPEKTLDMIAKVWEMAGLMVDEKR